MAKYIGGKVVLEEKKNFEYVTWSAQSKQDLMKVFDLLKTYPLLTSRKQAQLNFATNILKNKYTYSQFIENRNKKYENKLEILENLHKKNIPIYFPGWLSGFIEGEGNFSCQKIQARIFNDNNNNLRKSAFTIGLNDELHVLNWIKTYFNGGDNKITKDKPKKGGNFNHYRLHLYNADSRKAIFHHFKSYPLLGYKTVSYKKFYNYHN